MKIKENPLPTQVLALMYKNVLVVPTVGPVVPVHMPSLGGNKKHCLIVVHTTGFAYLPDDVLDFLTKILSAIQYTLNDVAIINMAITSVSYEQAVEIWNPTSILLFGIDPVQMGMPVNSPMYKAQQVGGIMCLYSNSLGECMESKELKAQLWQCLKSIFLNQ